MEREPTDAEFVVIEDRRPFLRDPEWLARPWWRRWYLEDGWWETALIYGVISGAIAGAAALRQLLHR